MLIDLRRLSIGDCIDWNTVVNKYYYILEFVASDGETFLAIMKAILETAGPRYLIDVLIETYTAQQMHVHVYTEE